MTDVGSLMRLRLIEMTAPIAITTIRSVNGLSYYRFGKSVC